MTVLKRIYPNKEAIPPDHAALFTETSDGKWALNIEVEGLTPTKRLEEFRTANTNMRARLEAYNDKEYGGGDFTPERATDLLGKAKDLDDAKLKSEGEVAKRVEERVAEMRKEWQKVEGALKQQLSDKDSKLQRSTIERTALEAGTKIGLRASAHEDLIDRVSKVFKVGDDGNPVAYESDGKTVLYGTDGERLTIDQFVKGLSEKAKHLFEDNGGAGAHPGVHGSRAAGSEAGEINPWAKETFNRTQQGLLVRKDPAKAQRMAARAGHTLEVSEADVIAAGQK